MKLQTFKNSEVRINFNNINVLKINYVDDNIELELMFKRKIKLEYKDIPRKFKNIGEATSFLKNSNFIKIDDFFINMNNVAYLEKLSIPEDMSSYKVNVYFNDLVLENLIIKKTQYLQYERFNMVF